jgi:hypothetical protein
MNLFIIITYLLGMWVFHDRYQKYSVLTVRDIIILLLSPLCVIPVVIMPILSMVIPLDYELFKKNN